MKVKQEYIKKLKQYVLANYRERKLRIMAMDAFVTDIVSISQGPRKEEIVSTYLLDPLGLTQNAEIRYCDLVEEE